MLVVFIAGASAAGKTKFAEQLLIKLTKSGIDCLSIKMDDYYKEMPPGVDFSEYKQMTNFDDPNRLDLPLLKRHILMLRQGKSIDKPVFDFKIERRVGTELVTPPTILLIDGTSALFFYNDFMKNLSSTYKIFIEATQETLLKRRIQRDLFERGYVDEMSILKKDADYVKPTFDALIEPTKQFADMLINNNKEDDKTVQGSSFMPEIKKTVEALKKMLVIYRAQ